MNILAAILACVLVFIILRDCFETVVLPRRPTRRLRLTRLYYKLSWKLWLLGARRLKSNRRDYYLSFYGPLSLILLLIIWAGGLILAFGLFQWSLGSVLSAPEKEITFFTDLYMSGTTFFTLGLGDVVPREGPGRFLTVLEGGLGIGFLALVIGYVPVIYQAFSRREVQISLLDARAGSPPSAAELIRRHIQDHNITELIEYIRTWEHWCADLLESHLSYSVLSYYRSQHERQSWVAALTTVLDVCAFVMVELDGAQAQAAQFTFAIARHAAVDLAQTFGMEPTSPADNRLSTQDFARMRSYLLDAGIDLHDEANSEARLSELRAMYEPFVHALADYLLTPLPTWIMSTETVDDWQTSAWDHLTVSARHPLRKVR